MSDSINNESKSIQVSTVAQKGVQKGFVQIIASTRETKESGSIPESEKRRCIIIPEFNVSEVPSKFAVLVREALESAAKAQLASLWEQDKVLKTVPAGIWDVEAILLFISREAESKRLSKETITEWLKTADLGKRINAANEEAKKKFLRDFLKLSAPTIDLPLEACVKLLASLAKSDEDCESLIGSQIVRRLEGRIETLKKQLEEIAETEEI